MQRLTSRNLENTVGVEIESDLDLGNTTRSSGDVSEFELSEHVVVLCHGAFAFVDLDQYYGLVVGRGGEDLTLAGGNGGTTLNQSGHDTTGGLDTESERVDIHENDTTGTFLAG